MNDLEARESPGRRTQREGYTVQACWVVALALLLVPITSPWTPASSEESAEPTFSTADGSLQNPDRSTSSTASGKDRTGTTWIDHAHGIPPSVRQTPNTGALEATITLAGSDLPSSTRVENSTDPDVCGREHDLQDLVVSAESRGVRFVIASLAGVPDEGIPDRGPERLVIDNRDCQFAPHAAVATLGDTIVALNSDPTLHNTHYYGPMRSNIALAREGMTASRVANRPGLVTVLCDVHGWMKAYLRIDPHPFHAVSDEGGQLRIEGIPPGAYDLELWHERLGERIVEVEIEAGETAAVAVEYPAESARR